MSLLDLSDDLLVHILHFLVHIPDVWDYAWVGNYYTSLYAVCSRLNQQLSHSPTARLYKLDGAIQIIWSACHRHMIDAMRECHDAIWDTSGTAILCAGLDGQIFSNGSLLVPVHGRRDADVVVPPSTIRRLLRHADDWCFHLLFLDRVFDDHAIFEFNDIGSSDDWRACMYRVLFHPLSVNAQTGEHLARLRLPKPSVCVTSDYFVSFEDDHAANLQLSVVFDIHDHLRLSLSGVLTSRPVDVNSEGFDRATIARINIGNLKRRSPRRQHPIPTVQWARLFHFGWHSMCIEVH